MMTYNVCIPMPKGHSILEKLTKKRCKKMKTRKVTLYIFLALVVLTASLGMASATEECEISEIETEETPQRIKIQTSDETLAKEINLNDNVECEETGDETGLQEVAIKTDSDEKKIICKSVEKKTGTEKIKMSEDEVRRELCDIFWDLKWKESELNDLENKLVSNEIDQLNYDDNYTRLTNELKTLEDRFNNLKSEYGNEDFFISDLYAHCIKDILEKMKESPKIEAAKCSPALGKTVDACKIKTSTVVNDCISVQSGIVKENFGTASLCTAASNHAVLKVASSI